MISFDIISVEHFLIHTFIHTLRLPFEVYVTAGLCFKRSFCVVLESSPRHCICLYELRYLLTIHEHLCEGISTRLYLFCAKAFIR